MSAETPFLFAQLSAWPDGDRGHVALLREAQLAALATLNNTCPMAIAADLSDPSGMWHPVHPPWKQELAGRMVQEALRVVYGNTSRELKRPQLRQQVAVDLWNPSWRDFHYGYGSVGGICRAQPWLSGWNTPCFGVRLALDSPIRIEGATIDRYRRGFPSGFELGLAAPGRETEWQPLSLYGLRDDNTTLQLNGTAAPFGGAHPNSTAVFLPAFLRYAWHDYPSMALYSAKSGRPVAPFRVNLSDSFISFDMKTDDTSDTGGTLAMLGIVAQRDAGVKPVIGTVQNRAANSRGHGSPTAPLGTPLRTPWIFSI
jgi:hypothetical protein